MLVTTQSQVENRGLVTCGLTLGLVILKFCELRLATKELALENRLLKMAEFTTLFTTSTTVLVRKDLDYDTGVTTRQLNVSAYLLVHFGSLKSSNSNVAVI